MGEECLELACPRCFLVVSRSNFGPSAALRIDCRGTRVGQVVLPCHCDMDAESNSSAVWMGGY